MNVLAWLDFVLAFVWTYIAVLGITLIYCMSMALLGRAFGIAVERIGIGTGPRLIHISRFGFPIEFRLIALAGHVKFKGQAEEHPEIIEPDSFQAASAPRLILIMLAGPLSAIMLGLALLAIPVVRSTPQIVTTTPTESRIKPCAVTGLAIGPTTTTWSGQMQFFSETVLYYVIRLLTFQSLSGWGGPIACLVTISLVAKQSLLAWATCIGVLSLFNGLFNLLPVPPLNGGNIVMQIWSTISGHEIGSGTRSLLAMIGLLFLLVIFGRAFFLDIRWFWQLLI